jgi:hypothetical protein
VGRRDEEAIFFRARNRASCAKASAAESEERREKLDGRYREAIFFRARNRAKSGGKNVDMTMRQSEDRWKRGFIGSIGCSSEHPAERKAQLNCTTDIPS